MWKMWPLKVGPHFTEMAFLASFIVLGILTCLGGRHWEPWSLLPVPIPTTQAHGAQRIASSHCLTMLSPLPGKITLIQLKQKDCRN